MSAEAVAWVYRYSPYSGVKFSIHQAIADTVNDTNGNEFWMRPAKLARKARTTRQTASTYLTEMVQEGFLEQLGDRSSGGDAPEGRFRFLTPEVPMQYDPLAPGGTVSSADGGGHRQESRRCTVSSADSTVSSADGKEPNRTQEETQVASSSSPSASTTISEGSDGGGVDGSSVVGRGPLLVDGSE
ncbi:MAG TPA: hypothetical protein VK088_08865, partial [Acidimicrobiia bacterium]|nr:hypothetical protein [Acidimicrobiia bacterium]